jgi:hypothetical protein
MWRSIWQQAREIVWLVAMIAGLSVLSVLVAASALALAIV